MKKVQLFRFNEAEIRTLTDEDGNPWFVAADVCRVLEYTKRPSDVVKQHCRAKGVTKMVIPSAGGSQSTTLINEGNLYRLAARSEMPEAEVFEGWIFDEVLPSLRKGGIYSLKSQLLPAPRLWEKTFPAEFMRNVMKLYGYKYDPKKGTPSFIGHFINDYVYNTLDKGLSKALKAARTTFAGDDEVCFLHQFLADPAREALQGHIMVLNGLAAGSANIDGFKQLYERAFTHRNQLEMYLR